MKPSLLLYYYPRQKNEAFLKAERKAQRRANADMFDLILFVTREPNHPGRTFVNRIGHYYAGMKSRVTKRIINSRTWWAPRDLVAHLCKPKNDVKALILSTGKSPIVLMDISPKCILDKKRNKWDRRGQLTPAELRAHFTKILSYRKFWNRIKLVVFSLEKSIGDNREEMYREARELFQSMIHQHYGKKEYLSVPFFGLGPRQFKQVKYWGASNGQMSKLSKGIGKMYPQSKKLIRSIVSDYARQTRFH